MEDKRRVVLVVEDDALISDMVVKNLKLDGYSTVTAQDGEECLRVIREEDPDLVLLDVLLPKLDGWEVLSRLRADQQFKDTPVIVLTALSDEQSKIQGLRGGADDYVTKPFSALELMARVNAVLKRSKKNERARDELFKEQIPARKGDKIYLVNVDKVNYISVRSDYTYLHTDEDRYLTNRSLSDLEKTLDSSMFFRAHRGYIVNVRRIKSITKLGASSFELTMGDRAGSKIPVSRRQSSELRKILNI